MRSAAVAALLCILPLGAQPTRPYLIETVAGTLPDDEGGPATSAVLTPNALATGSDGSVYVADGIKGLRRIAPDGSIAGIRGAGGASAVGLAVSPSGVLLYIGGPELYRYDPVQGTVATSRPTFGPASRNTLSGIAVDAAGNAIIADSGSRQIYRVTPAGVVTSLAGLGSNVQLTGLPVRVAVDSANAIYVLQSDNRVVSISPQGAVKVIAGNGQFDVPAAGGRAVDSGFGSLRALAVSRTGTVFLADSRYSAILKVDQDGLLQAVAADVCVADMAVGGSGELYFADPCAGKIQRIAADGTLTTLAGRTQFSGDGGPARDALLRSPSAVAISADGAILIGDTGNNRIRRVSPDGNIETIAGNGEPGAGEEQVAGPDFLAMDSTQNLYFAARNSQLIRRVRSGGVMDTVAGSGDYGSSGDGGASTAASFRSIDGLAVDSDGRLYVSDALSNRIRVITPDGMIQPYAGTGAPGNGEDGVPAVNAALNAPTSLAVDANGNLVFFESRMARLRRVDKSGVLSTLSSTLTFGQPGDADSVSCVFGSSVSALAFDIDGSLLVLGRDRLCRLMPDGTSWLVAGTGRAGFEGDNGPARSATFWGASGLAVDAMGAIYVADTVNRRIRKLALSAP